jgi:hypothetical protein
MPIFIILPLNVTSDTILGQPDRVRSGGVPVLDSFSSDRAKNWSMQVIHKYRSNYSQSYRFSIVCGEGRRGRKMIESRKSVIPSAMPDV